MNRRRCHRTGLCLSLVGTTVLSITLLLVSWGSLLSAAAAQDAPYPAVSDLDQLRDGKRIYQAACASCHGADGTGAPQERLGFDTPPPDFTNCSFATREPTADWVGVAHEGGSIRAFSRFMPAFGKA